MILLYYYIILLIEKKSEKMFYLNQRWVPTIFQSASIIHFLTRYMVILYYSHREMSSHRNFIILPI